MAATTNNCFMNQAPYYIFMNLALYFGVHLGRYTVYGDKPLGITACSLKGNFSRWYFPICLFHLNKIKYFILSKKSCYPKNVHKKCITLRLFFILKTLFWKYKYFLGAHYILLFFSIHREGSHLFCCCYWEGLLQEDEISNKNKIKKKLIDIIFFFLAFLLQNNCSFLCLQKVNIQAKLNYIYKKSKWFKWQLIFWHYWVRFYLQTSSCPGNIK